MSEILLHPTYFPSIVQMVAAVHAQKVIFEVQDNYQKQTYRNRAHIAHANGRLMLNVPIRRSGDGSRQKTRDVVPERNFPWQQEHWKSIQIAYRTSPFFEYYEDELQPLFSEPVESLLQHNLRIYKLLCELLGWNIAFETTTEYQKEPSVTDLRYLVESKKEKKYDLDEYIQVHHGNHGFLANLSVLDLLCNEGPNALTYLEAQEIKFN
ncbi:MAG: WbqC family protein [Bacteroidota bacterium]